jgi:hypothetical protein
MKTLDLVVVLAVFAGGALWIEHGHSIVIDAPAVEDLQAQSAAAACPDNDTMPYDSRCIDFLNASTEFSPRVRVIVVKRGAHPAPCPDSDKVPYSESCIAFLKGATETGMNWRANEQPVFPSAPQ